VEHVAQSQAERLSSVRDNESSRFLTFSIGGELFAAPLERIREVIEFPGITEIPLSSPVVPGVINLRGSVVPVMDLSVRFGRGKTPVARRTCVVVVETEFEDGLAPLGVIVDAVTEALEVEPQHLEPRPPFGTGIRSDFVGAMIRNQNRFVAALDLDAVLSVGELEELVAAAAASALRSSELE
jgi:purine-binding chemotaxis protein CheW